MPDINLLPEDLKKKQEKNLKKGVDFSLDDIEFTDGEKLKKQVAPKIKVPVKNRFKKWFKPRNHKKIKSRKEFKNLNNKYPSQKDTKQKEIEEFKFQFQADKKKDKLAEPINKNFDKKQEKPLNPPIPPVKSEIKKKNNQGNKKKKSIFSDILKKWKKNPKDKKGSEGKKEEGLDVNLLPFGSNVPTIRRMISILIIVFILSSALVFAIYFAYYVNKEEVSKNYNSLEEEINIYMREIKKYDELMKEVDSWQEKVEKIGNLLNKHIYWTEFFEKLEENTLPEVQFLSFAGSIDGPISLEALAPDYQTVSKQWILLQNADDFIKNVEIDGASTKSAEDRMNVSFSLTLEFVDGIFYKE